MAASQEVHLAVADWGAAFDLVISSAMNSQIKVAHDGKALSLPTDVLASQPGRARWRNLLVSVGQEPLVLTCQIMPCRQAPSHSGTGAI